MQSSEDGGVRGRKGEENSPGGRNCREKGVSLWKRYSRASRLLSPALDLIRCMRVGSVLVEGSVEHILL